MVKNLRFLRKKHKMSQQKLAELIGTTQQAIYKYEKTSVEPDIATLIRISEVFNVTVDYLIENTSARANEVIEGEILTEYDKAYLDDIAFLPDNVRENLIKLVSNLSQTFKLINAPMIVYLSAPTVT